MAELRWRVFCIARLRYLDDAPLVLHEAYLPLELGARVADLDLAHGSLSQMLAEEVGLSTVEES